MSGFNQTGPMGQGSMTGRKMGKCTNFGAKVKEQTATDVQENVQNNAQKMGRGMGRGFGEGRSMGGRGMGRGNRGGGRGQGRGNRGGGFNN
ncbi:MAG: DUF5320 domain-containing protein [Paludibacter sp.]|nr:DUF5320 domain-containing protein [Paludibacter sp.]